ncbi:MAG: 50S ribosomal protein L10 [Alphaproteobacteria bacterium]
MNRAEKASLVDTLRGVFTSANVVVVTHYSGLSVAEMTALRAQMAEAGASFKVTKNRLAKIALEGTEKQVLTDYFTGPTAIAVSDDPVAAPKVAVEFARKNGKLVILGGLMEETLLDAEGVKALAALPSLDELRARIAGMVNEPARRVAGVLQAPAGQLARVFGAYGAKDEAA